MKQMYWKGVVPSQDYRLLTNIELKEDQGSVKETTFIQQRFHLLQNNET